MREDIAPIFSKDFVEVKIDAEEMEGGQELIDALGGEGSGFPWLVILRADRSTVIDSIDPENGNAGFPRAEWEVEHWNVMMRASVTRISEEEILFMAETLREG